MNLLLGEWALSSFVLFCMLESGNDRGDARKATIREREGESMPEIIQFKNVLAGQVLGGSRELLCNFRLFCKI